VKNPIQSRKLVLIVVFKCLYQEANEAGALRLAKNKLEKQMEDLTWRLHLEKKIRVFALEIDDCI